MNKENGGAPAPKKVKNNHITLEYAVKTGILAAIATVLMFLEFPLSFLAPPFYKLDFSDLAAMLGAFALGPVAGVIIELIKNLLHILFVGTSTAYVGELANFVTGCFLVVPAAIIYKRKKSRKTALIGMSVGTLSLCLAGAVLNGLVLIPFYSKLYNLPLDTIIGMGNAIFPAVHDVWSLVFLCVVPFNLIKGVADSVVTLLLYKHLSPILHVKEPKNPGQQGK